MYTLKAMEEQKQKNQKDNKKTSKNGKKTQKIKLPNKMVIEVKRPNIFTNVFFYIFLLFAAYMIFGSMKDSVLVQEEIPIGQVRNAPSRIDHAG